MNLKLIGHSFVLDVIEYVFVLLKMYPYDFVPSCTVDKHTIQYNWDPNNAFQSLHC